MSNPRSTNAALSPDERAAKFERNSRLIPDLLDEDLPSAPEASWPPLDAGAALDRAKGCLLGLAVGEALGAGVQGLQRDEFPQIEQLAGGGPLGLQPGEWTGGTAMALALAETLLATGTVEQYDFMTRLVAWRDQGTNTAGGTCVGLGDTTRAAIESFVADDDPSAGSVDGASAGSGSLLRSAPVAIYWAKQSGLARFMANKQSRATHGTIECLDACELFTAQLVDALAGADKEATLRPRVMKLVPNLLALSGGEWKPKTREQICSGAYVVDTLEAALWAVWNGTDFRSTLILAANLGDEASGVAAVAGQLAGALYGASGIPHEWLQVVAGREKIERLAESLAKAAPQE